MTPLFERLNLLPTANRRLPRCARSRTISPLVAVAIWSAIGAPTMAAPGWTGPMRPIDNATVPDGLTATDWSSIRKAIEADLHVVRPVEHGHNAYNPGQQWRTRFDGKGFVTTPESGDWSWGLKLMSFGRGNAQQAVKTPVRVESQGTRMTYHWNDSVSEWFLNDQRGLEHGYTVSQRPSQGNGLLCFTLAVQGDLRPKINGDRRGIAFINTAGVTVVNYAGLTVFDADGASVPAWFDMNGDAIGLHVDDSHARYPLTIDPVAQQAYLKASNSQGGDYFGIAVAVSGDTVVVGANLEDSSAIGVNGDQSNDSASSAGAAYVFVRDGNGTWTQQAYLKASNTGTNDNFGASVAVSGDTIVVGAVFESSNATGVNGNQSNDSASSAGAAYVFVRNGTTWSQQAYLKASNTGAADTFGWSVAISGNTIAVGAINEASNATGVNGNQNDNSIAQSGAAYVFVRNGTTWSQQAYLKASNPGLYDRFGYSISVSGNTLVVGAVNESSNATGVNGDQNNDSAYQAGAAYVFVRNGTIWTQQAYLKASNAEAGDMFGLATAVSGDIVVVGAPEEDSNGIGPNSNQLDNSTVEAGAAYIFVRDANGVWTQQAYLKPSNTQTADYFAISVAASGDAVVIGACYEDSADWIVNGDGSNNNAPNSGAVYVFVRNANNWTQAQYIKAFNSGGGDVFGYVVAVSGDTVVAGAHLEDSNGSGVNSSSFINNTAISAGAAFIFDQSTDNEEDSDGDGVPDDLDVCPGTRAGLSVDCDGRPLLDCNLDCLVDGDDLQCLIAQIINQ